MSGILQALLSIASASGGGEVSGPTVTYGDSGSTESNSYTVTDIPEGSWLIIIASRARTSDGVLDFFLTAPDTDYLEAPYYEWTAAERNDIASARDTNDLTLGLYKKRLANGSTSETISLTGGVVALWSHMIVQGVDLVYPPSVEENTWEVYAYTDALSLFALDYMPAPGDIVLNNFFIASSAANDFTSPIDLAPFEVFKEERSVYTVNAYLSQISFAYTGQDFYDFVNDPEAYYDTLVGATQYVGTSSTGEVIVWFPERTTSIQPTFVKSNGDSVSTTLALPAVKAGEFVLVAMGLDSTSNLDLNISTAGWTEVADLYANDSWDSNLGLFWKRYEEDTAAHSITLSHSVQACAMGFRGVHATEPFEGTAATATVTNTASIALPTKTVAASGILVNAAMVATTSSSPIGYTSPPKYMFSSMKRSGNQYVNLTAYPSSYSGASLGTVDRASDIPANSSAAAVTVALRAATSYTE